MALRFAAAGLVLLFAGAAGQDTRGLGMGRLTLAIGSELSPLDMYGFGENPAGLYRSQLPRTDHVNRSEETGRSVLELYAPASYWRRAGEKPYEWAIGNPVPGQVQECFPHYTTDVCFDDWYRMTGDFIPYVPFTERPSGIFWRYRSTFALAVHGAWSYARLTEYPASYLSTPELGLTAAVPLGPIDIGLDMPASLTTNTWPYISEQSAFIGYRLGVVVPLRMLQLGAIVSAVGPYVYAEIPPIVTGWISNGTVESYSLQAMLRPADWLMLGATSGYRSAVVAGEFLSPWVRLRADCRPTRWPLIAGLEAEWARLRTYEPTFEIDQMDSVGAGLGAKVWCLSGGAEIHYAQRTYQDDTGAVRNPNWTTNAGAELDLGMLQVRLGYEHSVRPLVDVPGIGFNKYTGTAGFGLNVTSVRMDVAWNHSYWPFGDEVEDEVHLDLKRGW